MQPLESLKALGDPIYESFYGLKEQPFAITTDPKFLYLGQSHQRAFAELLNGLKRRESIMLLTGETGTGKTTLCRAVIEALGERTFSAMILNPYMAGAEVFRIILRDFGLVTHEDLRRGALAGADVPQLLDTLEGFLRSLRPARHARRRRPRRGPVARPQVLDQIRMLTALEQDGQRLVQIVLCGQPGLLTTLKTEGLYALNERITRRVALTPLDPSEVDAYIHHRLAIAGGRDAVRFEPEATQADRRAVARPAAPRQRALRSRAAGGPDRGREHRHARPGQARGEVAGRRARTDRRTRRAGRPGHARRSPVLQLTLGGAAETTATATRRGGRRAAHAGPGRRR